MTGGCPLDQVDEPNACAACGVPERGHFTRDTNIAPGYPGRHTWIEPTNWLRLGRMRERARVRANARTRKQNKETL